MAFQYVVKADGTSRLTDDFGNFVVFDTAGGSTIFATEAGDTAAIVGAVAEAGFPRLSDRALDFGLAVLNTETNRIVICTGNPTTFTGANSTLKVGHRDFAVGTAVAPPANALPNGRSVATTAFSDGVVTVTAVARSWALLDTANQRLLANGDLGAPFSGTSGTAFQLPSFVIRQPSQ